MSRCSARRLGPAVRVSHRSVVCPSIPSCVLVSWCLCAVVQVTTLVLAYLNLAACPGLLCVVVQVSHMCRDVSDFLCLNA